MADPRDAHLSFRQFRKNRLQFSAMTFCKKGGDDDLSEKISLVPTAAELHVHMVVRLLCG